ncbi:hypothetical protein H310_10016 [Aphanomyces invadans]|uniref:B30.2/SPRY domain-containing protein n=1 Tax=Aphanomyces invadans TaxID=157072 RepID=A0A024TRP6_9STRA|nr:hypothetical protein H310_10016 [Aphanomyces invadans]ETV96698.1 hypothetical protein H310_10016 [Aphanomyces invadans]|eukprot:XP_008874475.1 hypothetical protein H310_10016 [Aphanomyces invadans]
MGTGWNVIVATHPVDEFAVRMTWPASCSAPFSPVIAIGFTRDPNCWKIPVNHPPRSFPCHRTGWFVNANKGTVSTCDGRENEPCGLVLKSGDVLRATFDFTGETITFAQQLAPPCERPHVTLENVRSNALYPVFVSCDSGILVEFVELER